MTKSTITRERLSDILEFGSGRLIKPISGEEIELMARIALAAMDSEPHTDDELSNLLWYSQEATCHSDPNYYCEFQRLATPGLIAGIILELQELRKADSEPVAWINGCNKSVPAALRYLAENPRPIGGESSFNAAHLYQLAREIESMSSASLYRHAQQPVVPYVLERLRSIVSDPRALPRRKEWISGQQYSYVLLDNVEAMVDEACRAAMLQAGNSPVIPGCDGAELMPSTGEVIKLNPASNKFYTTQPAVMVNSPAIPDGWIPVSERMPDDEQEVIVQTHSGWRYVSFYDAHSRLFFDSPDGDIEHILVTHWMPLPAAPREVN